MVEIEDMVNPSARVHETELTSDLPGRTFDSVGQGRHRMEPSVETNQQQIIAFAKKIADRLAGARKKGEFDSLIMAASPSFLGILRQNLDTNTEKTIKQTINKDLVQMNEQAIRDYFE